MVDENIFLTNKKGTCINSSVLKSSSVKRDEVTGNKELDLLFDFYYKDGNKLSSSKLEEIYKDLATAAGNDQVLSIKEIKDFLKQNNLDGKVSANSVIEFFTKISENANLNILHDEVKSISLFSSLEDNIKNIPDEDIYKVLDDYENKFGTSLIYDIANKKSSLGTTRNSWLSAIRDKLAENYGNKSENFKNEFNGILKDMNLTIWSKADSAKLEKLEKLIEKYSPTKVKRGPKYPKPAKRTAAELEKINRQLIDQIMSNSDLCYVDKNKNEIKNRIMEYAKLNNPTEMVKGFLNDSNPKVREAAQHLLDSTFLDYFPVFVASIIAQESQFRETDSKVFSENGQGVMQITSALTADIFTPGRQKAFGKEFMDRLKNSYHCNDSTKLFKALANSNNVKVNLHYDVGTAGLKSKLYTLFNQIRNGTYDSTQLDLTNPATILEFVAINYNANSAAKHDKKQNGNISQVRYLYGRDVIERFRRYTPSDVKVRNYFEYNTKKNKFTTIYG